MCPELLDHYTLIAVLSQYNTHDNIRKLRPLSKYVSSITSSLALTSKVVNQGEEIFGIRKTLFNFEVLGFVRLTIEGRPYMSKSVAVRILLHCLAPCVIETFILW